MKRLIFVRLLAAAFVVMAVTFTIGCDPGQDQAADENNNPVEPVPVKVSAETSGRITKMTHDEGEKVKAGEVLFLCDTERHQAEVDRAQAAFELAEATLRRVEKLVKSKYGQATAEQLDRARSARDVVRADVSVAKITLKRASIRSRLDGYLERRYVDVGEYVEVGTPVADIVQIDRLKVYVEVPERDVSYIQRGEQVVLEFRFNGEGRFLGIIENIARVADPVTRTYRTKIVMDNPKMLIRPGMIGYTVLVRGKPREGVSIPLDSVIARKGCRYVMVEDGGRAAEREVDIASFDGQNVEIVSGLNVGDRLIVVGHRQVNDGEPVKIIEGE